MIAACRQAAAQIAGQVGEEIAAQDDRLGRAHRRAPARRGRRQRARRAAAERARRPRRDRGELGRGIAYWLGNAMLETSARTPQQIAEAVDAGELDLCALPRAQDGAIHERDHAGVRGAPERDRSARMDERRELRERLGERPPPLRYVLTATGDVYEDVVHAPGRRRGRRGHRRGDPLDRAEPARLRPLRPHDRGLRRHVRHAGELPDHARGAG